MSVFTEWYLKQMEKILIWFLKQVPKKWLFLPQNPSKL